MDDFQKFEIRRAAATSGIHSYAVTCAELRKCLLVVKGHPMLRKTLTLTGIKTAGLAEGEFEGWASTFGNVDAANDRVMPGAFAKSISADRVIPLNWEHRGTVDPRCMVGQVVKAEEVAEGLHIVGAFDVDSEFGAAAYRAVKARRIAALSIGYVVNKQAKGSDGVNELVDVDLVEVSVVSRPANDRAVVLSVKTVGPAVTETLRTAVARARVAARTEGTTMHDKTTVEERHLKGRDQQLALAKTIVETATELERDLTADEAASVQKHLDEADRIEQSVAAHRKSQTLMQQLDTMASSTQSFKGGEPVSTSTAAIDTRRLTFKNMSRAVATKMLGEHGEKALAPSGAAVVSQEFSADPIPLGRIATGLLDVLPVKVHSSSEFAYMRQTTRTNNAAVVAEGAVKPTSVIGVTRIEASLAVIAHLSESIPRFWLIDADSLQQFIDSELRYGLGVAVEAKIVADINATSGIQAQAFSTSVLTTLRRSITRLESNGYPAGSIVLHPNDWEGVELALSSVNAVEHLSLPYDPASRRLFGVPVVTTVSAAAGVGHVLAEGIVAVDVSTEGVGIMWSENSNADDFSRNLIRARCEGRFATSVYSPLGVVVADLTA